MKEKIQEKLKKALKEKNELEILTLRQILSSIKNAEIEKRRKLTDQELGTIILKEIKKREEAIVLYKKGERLELAEKEEKEIAILKEFLPKMISEEKIAEIVEKTIIDLKAGPGDFGKIMGQVMAKIKGQADGSLVSEIVKQKLGLK